MVAEPRRDAASRSPGRGSAEPLEQWAESTHGVVAGAVRRGLFATLAITAPAIAELAAPGQFVMVTVPGAASFLRRPISIFNVVDDRVGLLIEARGGGTERLAELRPGDTLELAGPLGSGFPLADVDDALLVGGGIGCAPLQFLADRLRACGSHVQTVFGFRDLPAAALVESFAIDELQVATEDGSLGRRGNVICVLNEIEPGPQAVVFTCGPGPMMAAVQRWAAARSLRGYASLEAHMACGTGACYGCIIDAAVGRLRVCSEGPVFRFEELNW